ncbi:methionyl-tRNA formyltransferase, mitochondrial isoform X2 [Bactrocera dorsalis]|uniref:Methionyl-tRNA formyltransferase, mitochondrial n=1 Tax=Bactrocera dorsalis TaxID=27457 RepID=A0A6I9VJ33_BACDO|nr:methionyl-tRNA formyltransferase, mitochondrial isoform X2 [Bactrocera dorsalis]
MLCINNFKLNFFKYRRKINESVNLILSQNRWKCQQSQSAQLLKNSKLKVLFFGTDTFSLPSLQALHNNYYSRTESNLLGVVTSFKNPANCVRTYAEQKQLTLYRWPVLPEDCQGYDLGVVVSFGHLIPERIIKSFSNGMINVHASLLPRWRGAAPIIYAIMQGDAHTGVSIMKIEPKHFDVGDVLAQREIPIRADILMPELHAKLAQEGANLLVNTLNNFSSCLESATKQNNELATFAPKITSTITNVNWSQLSAEQLHRRFRALFGFKHLNTRFQNKNIQVIDVKLPAVKELPASLANAECGSFLYDRNKRLLLVRCADNTHLEIHQLRVEGRKIMTATEFNNGFLKQINSTKILSFTSK